MYVQIDYNEKEPTAIITVGKHSEYNIDAQAAQEIAQEAPANSQQTAEKG